MNLTESHWYGVRGFVLSSHWFDYRSILNVFNIPPVHYRFPPTSPLKPLPSPPRENLENLSGDKGKLFKVPSSSRRGLKKQELLQSVVITAAPHSSALGLHCLWSLKFTDTALLWHLPFRKNSSDFRNWEMLRNKFIWEGFWFWFGFSLFCLSAALSLLRDFKVLGGLKGEVLEMISQYGLVEI